MKLSSIMGAVTGELKKEFNCKVYADDVQRNYNTPCFFIKLLITAGQYTKNTAQKKVNIILTYFPKEGDKDNLHYADLLDRVYFLFVQGIQVGKRHLKVLDISVGRAGEEDDIYQIYLTTEFIEALEVDNGERDRELIGDVSLVIEEE
ncbi:MULTISPECIES: phage tail terminator family protein [Veillonella]|uniref:phage tail terminator family protein n=1 Tax=Veillonella TaxID=29465 RepID=UPI000F8E6C1F|nr:MULTISPECIES: hypothetical protein [Veillonella]